MKLKITEESKRVLHLSDMDAVKELRKCVEEDSLSNYTHLIASIASGENGTFEILKSSAEIARNCRVWNSYGETADLDIWVTVYALLSGVGFYEIGCYLTDIWGYYNFAGENNREEIRNRMFVMEYPFKKFKRINQNIY